MNAALATLLKMRLQEDVRQAIVQAQIQRAAGEFGFKVGEKGQGGLFGFDGEVAK